MEEIQPLTLAFPLTIKIVVFRRFAFLAFTSAFKLSPEPPARSRSKCPRSLYGTATISPELSYFFCVGGGADEAPHVPGRAWKLGWRYDVGGREKVALQST